MRFQKNKRGFWPKSSLKISQNGAFKLFVMQYKKAPWLFLLQDNCWGINYDAFGKGGLLHRIIRHYEMYPKFVIVDQHPSNIWDGYYQIDNVEPDIRDINGVDKRIRTLYQKDEE